jgi:aryl-alcohol dehydrogenase-like predicted oxidoreductase
MRRSLEASLKRLGTDHVDLFYLHVWDYSTGVDEVMRGLDDLVRQGKVLYVGISDTPAWVVSQANVLAELRGWSRFVALQLPYSLAERAPERDLLPMASAHGMAVTAWGLLASGGLTGKYNHPAEGPRRAEDTSPRIKHLADVVAAVAAERGVPPSQVAINWVRGQTRSGAFRAPQVIPILGARSAAQLRENLGALDFRLTAEELARLSQANAIDLGFPHTFTTSPRVRSLIHGETVDRLDNHRL